MIRIENVDVFGWESAIRGMRNPMNSWDKSDSQFHVCSKSGKTSCTEIGNNDLKLMQSLVKAGTDHSKFMRMINVSCDITAPRYWWAEYDTYKVGTVRNSCSTMHKITAKEFTIDDFSHEHLIEDEYSKYEPIHALRYSVYVLNNCRKKYLATKNKDWWWQMIQILPQSYNQRATVQLNYATLRNMYHARKNHKLDEWVEFCKWVKTLPYSELITM